MPSGPVFQTTNRWIAGCLSLLLIFPNILMAQQSVLRTATVLPVDVNVYASASTSSDIVKTLHHADPVNVTLEGDVAGDQWCRLSLPDHQEPLGYVLCVNLSQNGEPNSSTPSQPEIQSRLEVIPQTQTATKTADNPVPDPAVLTNRDVVNMSKMGLSSSILVAKIKSTPSNFDTSPSKLQELKSAGLSDEVILAMVQAPGTPAKATPPPAAASVATTPPPQPTDGKVRVFVTDSQSWETRGGGSAGGNRNGWGASSWISGGARPQTAEIIKTLNERCPELTVTDNLGKANFVLTLDHEGGKGVLAHRNKIAVFDEGGDDIFSNSTRELGNAVKDACTAMLNDKKQP